MISSLKVQTSTIAWIKARPAMIAPIVVDEVRESEWQGNQFVYPNIRVRVLDLSNLLRNRCNVTDAPIDIIINSNQPSSLEAETIADAVITGMQGRTFTQSGVRFTSIIARQTPAFRVEGEGIWRSVVHLQAIVN